MAPYLDTTFRSVRGCLSCHEVLHSFEGTGLQTLILRFGPTCAVRVGIKYCIRRCAQGLQTLALRFGP